jgi:uncharacterized protein (TIRG00374 family)
MSARSTEEPNPDRADAASETGTAAASERGRGAGATPMPPAGAAAMRKPLPLLRRVLLATLLGGLVFVGLSLYGDVRALRTNLASFDPWRFAAAIGLATANYGLRFVRWQYYLHRLGVRVAIGESALVFLAGFVMSVTPGKVGEMFKSLLLYEARGASIATTAPVVIAERLTDLVALGVLTGAGALVLPQGPRIALLFGAIVTLMVAAAAFRPVGELLLRTAARLPVARKFVPRLREAYASLHAMTRPTPMLVATVLSVAAWGLEALALSVIVSGFPGVTLGLRPALFTYGSSTIAGALAMMPGGLGVTEAGMTGLLMTLGDPPMPRAVATTTTVLTRIATLWWAVALGGAALVVLRRSVDRRARTV